MTDLNRLFADLARHATELDPHAIRTTILATIDDGLRAASYDGPNVSGTGSERTSHPERQALNERRDPTSADLAALEHHVGRYVEAIHWIATRSHTGPFPTDWRSAVPGHRRLADMDAVDILDRSGQRPARWVHMAGDALHDLELIGRRHVAREAEEHEKSWTSGLADEDCCRLCLEHVNLRVERKAKGLCQMHLRLFNDSNGIDAPEWLTVEFRRIGSPAGPDWKRARSHWLQSLGVQDRSA